jgi:hypothetical protein
MVKDAEDPTLPAPIDFIGYRNGTSSPFTYAPTLVPFNGTYTVDG